MSCDVTVVVVDGDPTPALTRIAELESRWSRFLPGSELNRLNRANGTPCAVSADTVALVVALVEGWHATGGAFDPTMLGALVELGYAASRDDAARRTSLPEGVASRGRPEAIVLDRDEAIVQLPEGTVLDPGGLGKGLAADLVVAELIAAGAQGALVEIGGDVRVAGRSPEGAGWPIAVDHGTGRTRIVAIESGGVATSSTRRRTWRHGHSLRHHLLDPATLTSTDNDVESATVIAGTARWAEVMTKPAFTMPIPDALALLERTGVAATLTTGDGTRHRTTAWDRFELEVAA